jgi:hypothetical protein
VSEFKRTELVGLVEKEPVTEAGESWLRCAADLLRNPDPGPTPWLVEGLVVESALCAIVGPPKVAKTWVLLELASAIASGRPAFDVCPVPTAGPVVVVVEESGEAALHRRLDMMRRGRSLEIEDFALVFYAANQGVRLDDRKWQEQLLATISDLQPRAVFFDPLARMKKAERNESAQHEMAPLFEFLRHLRDATSAAVGWVHHQGHQGGHGRGTSDHESIWESRLGVSRGDAAITILADHREAESGASLRVRPGFDSVSRSVRFTASGDAGAGPEDNQLVEAMEKLSRHLEALSEPATGNEITKAGVVSDHVGRRALAALVEHQFVVESRSGTHATAARLFASARPFRAESFGRNFGSDEEPSFGASLGSQESLS